MSLALLFCSLPCSSSNGRNSGAMGQSKRAVVSSHRPSASVPRSPQRDESTVLFTREDQHPSSSEGLILPVAASISQPHSFQRITKNGCAPIHNSCSSALHTMAVLQVYKAMIFHTMDETGPGLAAFKEFPWPIWWSSSATFG